MASESRAQKLRTARALQGQLAAAKRQVVVEVAFDSTPAPPTTVAERLAMPMSKPPAELGSRPADAPSLGAAGAQVPRRAPRAPREPISPRAWRSQSSRHGEALSRGVRDAQF